MKKVEKWKSRTFVGSLALIAVITNGLVAPHQSERSFPVSQPQTAIPATTSVNSSATKAAEREQYIERIMNSRPTRTAGTRTLAIVAVNENQKLNSTLGKALAERVKGAQTKALTSLFTPEFISEGLFQATFDESPKAIDELGLRDRLDMILLAQQKVEYTTNPSLENVLTASMTLEVKLVSVSKRGESQAWTFTSSGAGFTKSDARKAAEERIIKEISTDTNISSAIEP
jgi:hypothetical protein